MKKGVFGNDSGHGQKNKLKLSPSFIYIIFLSTATATSHKKIMQASFFFVLRCHFGVGMTCWLQTKKAFSIRFFQFCLKGMVP